MALLKYLRNKDCLLDPRDYLSTIMLAKAICSANEAVRCEIEASSSKKRRGYLVLNLRTDPVSFYQRKACHLIYSCLCIFFGLLIRFLPPTNGVFLRGQTLLIIFAQGSYHFHTASDNALYKICSLATRDYQWIETNYAQRWWLVLGST